MKKTIMFALLLLCVFQQVRQDKKAISFTLMV